MALPLVTIQNQYLSEKTTQNIYIKPKPNAPRTEFQLTISANSHLKSLKKLITQAIVPLILANCILPFALPTALLSLQIINTLAFIILQIKTGNIINSDRNYIFHLNRADSQTQPADVTVTHTQ